MFRQRHINQLQAHNEILSTALRILWERHNNQEQTLFAQRRRAPPIHKICQEVGSLESRGSNQHSPVSVGLKQEAYSPSSGLSTNSPPSMPFDPLSSGSGSISTFGSPPPSLDNPPPLTTDNSPEASNSTQSSDYMPAPQSVFSGNGHDIQGSSPFGQPFEYEQKFSMPQQNFSTPAMGYAPDLKSMNGSAPGRGPLQYGPQYDFGHNPFDTQSKPFDMQSRPVDMQSKALDMKSEPLDIDDLMDMGMSSSCFDMPDWGLSLPN